MAVATKLTNDQSGQKWTSEWLVNESMDYLKIFILIK